MVWAVERLAAARADGGVRAVPAAVLRHRAAHAGRLADDGCRSSSPRPSRWSCSSSTSAAARRRACEARQRRRACHAARPRPGKPAGGHMLKVLIPVDGTRNCEFAVRHVVRQFMNNTAMEIHLLNVQAPFSSYITRFLSRKSVHDYHHDEAEKALRPSPAAARQLRHSLRRAHRDRRARGMHHRHRAPAALRPDRDGRRAQELAHAAGRELDHQPGARADTACRSK